MDLILEVRTGRERVTMVCHGKLVGGKEADTFRRSAILLLGGFDKLNINLAGVRLVDCGGLGSLESVLALATESGKEVRITHVSAQVKQLLQMSSLDKFVDRVGTLRPYLVADDWEAIA